MISQTFLDVGQVLLLCFATVVIFNWVKRLLTSGSASIGKGTHLDETLNQNVNFYVWDTEASRAKKIKSAGEIAYARKIWWQGEMQRVEEQAVADKEEGKAVRPVGIGA